MKKVALSGGASVNLLNTPYNFFGLTWGPRNTIAYAPQFDSAIWELPAGGGSPRELTKLDRNKKEVGHHWPELSPRGDLAYVPGSVQSGEMTLVLADTQGATRPLSVVANAYHMPRFSPDGSRVAVWIIG